MYRILFVDDDDLDAFVPSRQGKPALGAEHKDGSGEALRGQRVAAKDGHRPRAAGGLPRPRIEQAMVPDVVEIFRETCSGREVEVPLVLTERLKDWQDRVVHYAGATILVVDLAEVIRI